MTTAPTGIRVDKFEIYAAVPVLSGSCGISLYPVQRGQVIEKAVDNTAFLCFTL